MSFTNVKPGQVYVTDDLREHRRTVTILRVFLKPSTRHLFPIEEYADCANVLGKPLARPINTNRMGRGPKGGKRGWSLAKDVAQSV